MDHTNPTQSPLGLGLYAGDADSFHRVWQRVMPEEQPGCPIVPAPMPAPEPRTLSAEEGVHSCPPPQSEQPARTECPTQPQPDPDPLPTPALPEQPDAPVDRPGRDDFPPEEGVPCLGSGSAVHGGHLQHFIRTELEGWQFYRHLARRVNGQTARALSALASEKHHHARRLAAAYFLISGLRFWPTDRLGAPRMGGWMGTLRERFNAEQRQEQRLHIAACDTRDPCLRDLYREVAQGCAAHAALIRELLERSM